MKTDEFVVAVDIGSSKICAIAGSMDEDSGKVDIIAFSERVYEHNDEIVSQGKVSNLERVATLLDEVVADVAQQIAAPVEVINVSISGNDIQGKSHQSTITRSERDTTIQDTDVDDLLLDIRHTLEPAAGVSVLHLLPQYFIVGKKIVNADPVGHVDSRLGGAFYAITCPTVNLKHLHETVNFVPQKDERGQDKRNGNSLNVDFTLFSPIADAMGLLDKRDRDGVAVVNIGKETTELIVFSMQGVRHISVIEYAGNTITSDLMQAFDLTFEDAEKLKITCGSISPDQLSNNEVITISNGDDLPEKEVPARGVTDIIELRLREIASIVASELLKSGYENRLPQGLILAGGTSNLYICREIFSETTNLHSRMGKPLRHIKRNPYSKLENPKYATGIGLLLASFIPFDTRVPETILHNDYHVKERQDKSVKQTTTNPIASFFDRLKRFGSNGGLGGTEY